MKKRFEFISHIFSLISTSQHRKAWNILYLFILRKYAQIWYLFFKNNKTSIISETIKKDPILVYQKGKVGSSSLFFSLQVAYLKHKLPNVQIYHSHFLNNLEMQTERFKQQQPHKMHIIDSYKKIRYDFDNEVQKHWNVISLVRDPIARSIGAFFENFDRYIPDWQKIWKSKTLTIENVINIFLNAKETHLGHTWFDNEFRPVFNIDVYETRFPTTAGYKSYNNPPKVDLLVIRLEDLNRVGNDAIGGFLGIPDFSLYKANIGEEKEYAEIYNAFKSMPLPLEYINKMYETKYARHFYTEEELAAFAKKWSKSR